MALKLVFLLAGVILGSIYILWGASVDAPTPQPGAVARMETSSTFYSKKQNKTLGLFRCGSDEVDLSHPWLSDEELLSQVTECRRLHPSIIYYNRVPKCGSTTIQSYVDQNKLYKESKGNPFRHVSYYFHPGSLDNPFNHVPGEFLNPREVEFQVNEMLNKRPAVFDSHTAYASYLPTNSLHKKSGFGDMAYISVVREPLSRLLSWKGYDCSFLKENCDVKLETFARKLQNLQLAFLCGHQKECLSRGKEAAYISKVRIIHTFGLVGITERLNETTRLLQKILPDFFPIAYNGVRENVKTPSSTSDGVSDHDLVVFKELNSHDIDVYNFALKVFEKKMLLCQVD